MVLLASVVWRLIFGSLKSMKWIEFQLTMSFSYIFLSYHMVGNFVRIDST